MADHNIYDHRPAESSRSSGVLAFIVGGLVVLVAALAFIVFSDGVILDAGAPSGADIDINTSADSATGAEAADDGADASAAAESGDAAAGAAATSGD